MDETRYQDLHDSNELAVHLYWFGQSPQNAVGQRCHISGLVQSNRHDDEFIATEPSHHVGSAHHGFESPADFDQEFVACIVAQRVVHCLETIEVDHDQPCQFPRIWMPVDDRG